MGAEISSIITEQIFDHLDAPVKRIAAIDVPIPFSKVLEDRARPGIKNIIEAIKDFFRKDTYA